tara:strand:- start:3593 stop:4252 length:660 start_codon:yes stop_codon:yes gene_type:complete
MILLAIIFFIIVKLNIQILLSIVIVIFLYININENIKLNAIKNNDEKTCKELQLIKDIENIEQINTNNLYTHNNKNKNIKFMKENEEFINIIYNIRFIKKFDKTRHNNIIINMNKLMKIYMYILSDRYEINTYLPIFNDTKDNILELLYSIIFVVPDRFKHIYGFNPYQEIETSTKNFILKYNIMLNILINYGKIEKKYAHINYEKYKPYEKNKEHYLP